MFVSLILKKTIELVPPDVTFIIHFPWGLATDPAGGAYSAPHDSQLDLRDLLLRGETKKGGKEKKGKGHGRREEVEGGISH